MFNSDSQLITQTFINLANLSLVTYLLLYLPVTIIEHTVIRKTV